ncbi:MAG: helix-turn-helix transcriptional regulator [Bacteroidales bacterium]|nr:helix-turn-helix transcriptional regulator [Bacteroidales bacterium]
MTRVLTKKEFAIIVGVSSSTLSRWLNRRYYDELVPLGYVKGERILSPKVLAWLCDQLAVEL